MENNTINAKELFQGTQKKAQKIMQNPDKLDNLLKKLEKKLEGVPKLGGALVYIPKMAMMLNSYIRGQYTEVPLGIIAAVVGVLLYFVSPIDAVPDLIPVVGLLDDAAVAGASLYLVKSDLDEYMAWRTREGLEDDETLTA